MQEQQANPEIDLGPWAAYVLGFRAQILRLVQEMLWINVFPRFLDKGSAETLFKELLRSIRDALLDFALADQLRGGVHPELHRALDKFNKTFKKMVKSLCPSDPKSPSSPGLEDWRKVVRLVSALLPNSSKLRPWSRLGAILGRCYLLLWQQPANLRDGLAEALKELPEVVSDLGGGDSYPFLREVTRWAEGVSRSVQTAPQTWGYEDPIRECIRQNIGYVDTEGWYIKLAFLNMQVRSALRDRRVPEPLLVLTEDYLEFFGERFDFNRLYKNQISCLRVLAENAGQPVSHKTMIEEGKMNLELWTSSIKSVVSRLRKMLRPIIERHRRREGGLSLPGEDDAFIVPGQPDKNGSRQKCTYTHLLDPSRVKVVGPRPSWMKPGPSP
jgi:hypothetical protein